MSSTIIKYNRQTNLITFIGAGVYKNNVKFIENHIFNLKNIHHISTYMNTEGEYILTLKCSRSGNFNLVLLKWNVYYIVKLHEMIIDDKSFELKASKEV